MTAIPMVPELLERYPDRSDEVRAELGVIAEQAAGDEMAIPSLDGQLIRPIVALAGWRSQSTAIPPREFWYGAMAVQMAHEASLLHDDVVDGAARRRGVPTVAAARGTAAALVQGDHLLTTSYRFAARTGSPVFVELFARAVERTVAGELAQARATGRMLQFPQYAEIASGKSGELLGCALALAPSLNVPDRAGEYHTLGRRIGLVYQMLDDLLDLSPATDTGKPALADYQQNHWTWPLGELDITEFGLPPGAVLEALQADSGNGRPLHRCLGRYEAEVAAVSFDIRRRLGQSPALEALLASWRYRAHEAVRTELEAAPVRGTGISSLPTMSFVPRRPGRSAPSNALMARVEPALNETEYLSHHSRSFRFATRFFPRRDQARIARVYAYCRLTDDLVDDPDTNPADAAMLLDEWMELSRLAYQGTPSGVPLLDSVMREAAESGVPLVYAEELAEGMRMDLRGERYASMDELRSYTYRVASVVGLWVTELFGVRDPAVLVKAEAMGHAMQLTNILRDVGEDLRAGRCYLPADLMQRHRVTEAELRSGSVPAGYPALIEETITAAETAYETGMGGLTDLPRALRVPVSVAAHVYRGILDEIRELGYDNLNRRARTSGMRKAALAARALLSTIFAVLLFGGPLEAAVVNSAIEQERIRTLYIRAVHSAAAIPAADSAIGSLLARASRGSSDEAVLRAYSGAVRTLRAKHGRWPPSRLRDLNKGLRVLDGAVSSAPDIAEIRYLRLMSCYYLPGVLGRSATVDEDFRALARLLPRSRHDLSPELYRAVSSFVLERGRLTENEKRLLAPASGP